MIQARRLLILAPLVAALALPAATVAAAPRHAKASTNTAQRTVTSFPMADGAAPFGVTAGPRG